MREAVFDLLAQLGERALVTVGNKQRVIAEAVLSPRLPQQAPLADSLRRPNAAGGIRQGQHTAKPRATVRDAPHLLQQAPVVGRIVRSFPSVARRQHAGTPAQCRDFQAGVVGQRHAPRGARSGQSLLHGIGLKRGSVLHGRGNVGEIQQRETADAQWLQQPDEFGHFPVSQLKFSSRFGRLASAEFQRRTGKKAKVNGVQFGYEVRCHLPTAFDVMLGSQLGVGAYRALAEEGKDGVMVSVTGQLALVYKQFSELINYEILRAHDRPIDPDEDFHKLARYLEPRVDDGR